MGKIVSIVNQKGGVSKTTITANVAAILAEKELKILVLDMDPQANLTSYFIDKETEVKDAATIRVLFGQEVVKNPDIIHHTRITNLYIVPSSSTLAAISWSTGTLIDAQRRVSTFLSGVKDEFDLILIDTQPDLSTYTLNALAASDYFLVPLQPERMSVNGFSLLSDTVNVVRSINSTLDFLGVICTQYDGRIASHKSWRKTIKDTFGDKYIGDIHSAAIMKDCSDRKKTITEVDKSNRPYQQHLVVARALAKVIGVSAEWLQK
jgi:chromosome partitioning protein